MTYNTSAGKHCICQGLRLLDSGSQLLHLTSTHRALQKHYRDDPSQTPRRFRTMTDNQTSRKAQMHTMPAEIPAASGQGAGKIDERIPPQQAHVAA